VRVYYEPSVPHIEGRITSHKSDGWLEDYPMVALEIDGDESEVDRVEFVGFHDSFAWKGVGVCRQWHFSYRYDEMLNHIGTDDEAPYEVEWDTEWVPDSDEPVSISARIVDNNGMIYMAPAAENLKWARERIVNMYTASGVPGNFSGVGGRRDCKINIGDNPSGALRARMFVSTWNGDNEAGKITFNGTLLHGWMGYHHDRAFINLEVPTSKLQQGANNVHIDGRGESGHAFEVNWPGPVVFVEHNNPNPPLSARNVSDLIRVRSRVAVSNNMLVVNNAGGGRYEVELMTLGGRTVLSRHGEGAEGRFPLTARIAAGGLYIARLTPADHRPSTTSAVRVGW
jgi:hypothetical protein